MCEFHSEVAINHFSWLYYFLHFKGCLFVREDDEGNGRMPPLSQTSQGQGFPTAGRYNLEKAEIKEKGRVLE